MKNTFKVKIKIKCLFSISEKTHEIKAKNLASAQKKAYEIIGNKSGEIISIFGQDDKNVSYYYYF
jgi:hypothetical protein